MLSKFYGLVRLVELGKLQNNYMMSQGVELATTNRSGYRMPRFTKMRSVIMKQFYANGLAAIIPHAEEQGSSECANILL
jgi:hypothetical protein